MWCDETQQDGECALSGAAAAARVVESSLFTKRMAAYSATWFNYSLLLLLVWAGPARQRTGCFEVMICD